MGITRNGYTGPRRVLTGIVIGIFLVFWMIGWATAASFFQPVYTQPVYRDIPIPDIVVATTTESRGMSYVACGADCTCLTDTEAQSRFGSGKVKCSAYACGSETAGAGEFRVVLPKYCYKAQQQAVSYVACGQGCQCLMESEAQSLFGANYARCSNYACGQNHYCFHSAGSPYVPAGQGGGVIISTGSLAISSWPEGATVRVDGEKQGITPATVGGLTEGYHSVRLNLDGYEEFAKTPWVAAGSVTGVNATLVPSGEGASAGINWQVVVPQSGTNENPPATPPPAPVPTPAPGCGSSGQSACGGKCVDLKTDPHNCGTCGTYCSYGCLEGRCRNQYGCLIVTATFGSPQAREVQLVRDFRDSQIKQSYTGSRFMEGFDAWYYSFSPEAAAVITDTPALKMVVQAAVTPLLGIVALAKAVYSLFVFSPDLATVVTIIFGSGLFGLVYIVPPLFVILWYLYQRQGAIPGPALMKPAIAVWAGIIILLAASILFSSDVITTLSSGLLVVITIIVTAGSISLALAGFVLKRPAPVSR